MAIREVIVRAMTGHWTQNHVHHYREAGDPDDESDDESDREAFDTTCIVPEPS